MRNDLRLALSIKLYNPPKVEKYNYNPRLMSNKESISEMIKSFESGYLYTR
jgi:hypothetical protein